MLLITKAYVKEFDPTAQDTSNLGIESSEEITLEDYMFRTEDVQSMYMNPNNNKQTVIVFYEDVAHPVIASETFQSLTERLIYLEMSNYYSQDELDMYEDGSKIKASQEIKDDSSIEEN